MKFLSDERGQVPNLNKTTTILVFLGILAAILSTIQGYLPAQQAAMIPIILSVISEVTNAVKSGFENKTEESAIDEGGSA